MTPEWLSMLTDTSRLAIFGSAICLVVHGSRQSLKLDEEETVDENGTVVTNTRQSNLQILDSKQALFLPVGASVSLLMLFYFFDSMQFFFTVVSTVIAGFSVAAFVLPFFQYIFKDCPAQQCRGIACWSRYCECCGPLSLAGLASALVATIVVVTWVLTAHWALMDALGYGVCVCMIAYVRVSSLRVSTVLLCGLLLYDVFWVFFSSAIFHSNVMLDVATKEADNPVSMLANRMNLKHVGMSAPQLSLPGKLMFPSTNVQGHFAMLGLGDIVMPGLLLCFVMRFDHHKAKYYEPKSTGFKYYYFTIALMGYAVGLLLASMVSELTHHAQPALLYLVPCTLIPVVILARVQGDLRRMWVEPFAGLEKPADVLTV
ncbi:signal peptide peptidase-like 3 [Corticium candelabrum]|uniref:signal peptide peptidase-like 3 n=1 Tax=Corticium candelabrum TaxID=121492 RepID=UPI002E261B99|nr:signal peptide peptidase-like 3 [Corticium candelabrum]